MSNLSASNAVIAKAKALYGKSLNEKSYRDLSNKHSMAEITSYLKNDTYYDTILDGVNEHSVHRGYLEQVLRGSYFIRFASLLRYAQEDRNFMRFGILNIEVHQLVNVLYSLNRSETSDQIAQLPLALNRYVEFDLEKLISVRNIDQLIEVVEGTVFYDALKNFKHTENRELDLLNVEIAIKSCYYQEVHAIIERQFHGQVKEQMKELYDIQIELHNIEKIYRLKKFYQQTPEQIKPLITPIAAKIPMKTLYRWIDEDSAEAIMGNLKESPYRSYLGTHEFLFIENTTEFIKHQIFRRLLKFSTHPDVIIIAYMELLDQEIQNIIDIIEGVRYRLSPEKIESTLIY